MAGNIYIGAMHDFAGSLNYAAVTEDLTMRFFRLVLVLVLGGLN